MKAKSEKESRLIVKWVVEIYLIVITICEVINDFTASAWLEGKKNNA